jgi:hypothetical protein
MIFNLKLTIKAPTLNEKNLPLTQVVLSFFFFFFDSSNFYKTSSSFSFAGVLSCLENLIDFFYQAIGNYLPGDIRHFKAVTHFKVN